MKIKEMPLEDRPREKFLARGASSLSDAELLAILLRTGTREGSAVDIAGRLLDSAGGNLEALSLMSFETMRQTPGVGTWKALSIGAAAEFARRLACQIERSGKIVMDNPEDAAGLLQSLFTTDRNEECWCLFLRRDRRLISSARISEGSEIMTEISIKNIIRKAIDFQASAVILSHNHPGGDPRPSKADVRQTIRLRRALETFDISLMDHIILSGKECYSFSTESVFRASQNI